MNSRSTVLLHSLLIVFAGAAAPACQSPAPRWTCTVFGEGPRCETALETPGGADWDCYAVSDDIVCLGPDKVAAVDGWQCSSTFARTECVRLGAAAAPRPPRGGWQCRVQTGRVICDPRRYGNDPWQCQKNLCRERMPDFPSADEWECIESSFGALCRGRFLNNIHPQWRCAPYQERFLCINLNPDRPGDTETKITYSCKYDNSASGRACTRKEIDACKDCPGACIEGRCYPAYSVPTCFFNNDCGDGKKCRLGTCV